MIFLKFDQEENSYFLRLTRGTDRKSGGRSEMRSVRGAAAGGGPQREEAGCRQRDQQGAFV
jgi:hypothetical protein